MHARGVHAGAAGTNTPSAHTRARGPINDVAQRQTHTPVQAPASSRRLVPGFLGTQMQQMQAGGGCPDAGRFPGQSR